MILYPELLPGVQEALAETTGREKQEFTPEKNIGDIVEDSIAYVNLLMELEEEFDLPPCSLDRTTVFQGGPGNRVKKITVEGITDAVAEILYGRSPQEEDGEQKKRRTLLLPY